MYNRQILTNAVREGTRNGVLMRPTPRDQQAEDDAICNRVVDYAGTYLVTFGTDELACDENVNDGDYGDIEIERDPNELVFGTDLTVSVEYTYRHIFLGIMNIKNTKLTGRTVMRKE
jgi:hypothetical protein